MKIGLRTTKTAFAIFISTMIFYLLTLLMPYYADWFSPFFCSIAAAFSIQPGRNISLKMGKRRAIGTLIGGTIGMLVVFVCSSLKDGSMTHLFFYYVITSSMVLILIPLALKLKQQDAVFVTILTYCSICYGIYYLDHLQFGINRIMSTLIGIGIACLISVYRFPRKKQTNILFTCAINSLLENNVIDSKMKYKINYVLDYNIDLILTTHHSEAELDSLLEGINLKNKLIVLNGAALYDSNNKTYHNTCNFSIEEKNIIDSILDKNNIFALRYVITTHFNKLNVFYNKKLPQHYIEIDESLEYDYTNANVLDETYVTQYQIIDTLDNINKIKDLFNEYALTIRRYNNEYHTLYINSVNTSKVNQLKHLNVDNKKIISFVNNDPILSEVADSVYCIESSNNEVKNISKEILKNNIKVIDKIRNLYFKR